MNRIVCIIFTVLAAVTPARGQDKSDVNSASERYLSPVRALGRSEIAGHNAGSFLLWDIPTYSDLNSNHREVNRQYYPTEQLRQSNAIKKNDSTHKA